MWAPESDFDAKMCNRSFRKSRNGSAEIFLKPQDRTHGLFGISECISTTRMVGPWLGALRYRAHKKKVFLTG